MRIPIKTLFCCFMRSHMLNAAYNPQGLQNIGFMHSLAPGLATLYQNKLDFLTACRRYAAHFNCNPLWGPFLTGAFLHFETAVANGKLSPAFVEALRETVTNTFSALGDSFFSGSLAISLALTASCLVLSGYPGLACILGLGVLLFTLGFRLVTFIAGVRQGLGALDWLSRFRLINLGDYLKILNALLLCAALSLALGLPPQNNAGPGWEFFLRNWAMPLTGILTLSYLVGRLHFSRIAMAIIICLLAWFLS